MARKYTEELIFHGEHDLDILEWVETSPLEWKMAKVKFRVKKFFEKIVKPEADFEPVEWLDFSDDSPYECDDDIII